MRLEKMLIICKWERSRGTTNGREDKMWTTTADTKWSAIKAWPAFIQWAQSTAPKINVWKSFAINLIFIYASSFMYSDQRQYPLSLLTLNDPRLQSSCLVFFRLILFVRCCFLLNKPSLFGWQDTRSGI